MQTQPSSGAKTIHPGLTMEESDRYRFLVKKSNRIDLHGVITQKERDEFNRLRGIIRNASKSKSAASAASAAKNRHPPDLTKKQYARLMALNNERRHPKIHGALTQNERDELNGLKRIIHKSKSKPVASVHAPRRPVSEVSGPSTAPRTSAGPPAPPLVTTGIVGSPEYFKDVVPKLR